MERNATLRIEESSLTRLLRGTQKGGFVRLFGARISLLDDGRLYIEIPGNAGTAEDYAFTGLDLFVPVGDLIPGTETKEIEDGNEDGDGKAPAPDDQLL